MTQTAWAGKSGGNLLYLVRHGATAWNLGKRYLGWTDQPLAEAGRAQADRLASCLAKVDFTSVRSSDLLRARETAQLILAGKEPPIAYDARLREASFGSWEGMTFTEIEERFPGEIRAWLDDPPRFAPPGGETLVALTDRVRAVLDEIQAGGFGGRTLIVTHGGPARVMLCLALGLAPEQHWRFQLEPGGIAVVEMRAGEGTLLGLDKPTGSA